MNKSRLNVSNLSKSYKINETTEQQILKDINLEIREDEFVTIMGPSGSGKSTLLYSISGMDSIDSGDVLLNDENIGELNEQAIAELRLKKMGFVFQQPHFLNNLNIYENIILPGYSNKDQNKKVIEKRADDLIKKTNIQEIINKNITQVSGGQLQRASVCRALINSPDILFGDEPTGALNSKATDELLALFQQINDCGTTILITTHDIKVACRSERIVFIKDGVIIDEKKFNQRVTNENELKNREEELTQWLINLGF